MMLFCILDWKYKIFLMTRTHMRARTHAWCINLCAISVQIFIWGISLDNVNAGDIWNLYHNLKNQ